MTCVTSEVNKGSGLGSCQYQYVNHCINLDIPDLNAYVNAANVCIVSH